MNQKLKKRVVIAVSLTALVVLIGGGTILFHALEEWTWAQSFYFTIVTITTVGYGDLTPTSDATRIVTALFILFGVSIGAGIISFYGSHLMKNRVSKRIQRKSKE